MSREILFKDRCSARAVGVCVGRSLYRLYRPRTMDFGARHCLKPGHLYDLAIAVLSADGLQLSMR